MSSRMSLKIVYRRTRYRGLGSGDDRCPARALELLPRTRISKRMISIEANPRDRRLTGDPDNFDRYGDRTDDD